MAEEPVHYEIFIRPNIHSGWTLDAACEDRRSAIEAAEEALKTKRAIGVRVSKESRRPSGDYASVVILARGDLEPPRRKSRTAEEAPAPLCVGPADLYTVHARERLVRLFEGWLRRHSVTAFELLHRADLVEKLDATGLEIQHAIQKVAVPEAQSTGASTHEVIRRFQRLTDAAIARLVADQRRGAFPDVTREGLAAVLQATAGAPDAAYLLGGAVAKVIAKASDWTGKIERLLDLADACGSHPSRAALFHVLQQPLTEILGGRAVLAELLGGTADLGRNLVLLTRLAAPQEVEAFARREPEFARAIPEIGPKLLRLAHWLARPEFEAVTAAVARRVLDELNGPRRLHPDDPAAEILTLRALAHLLVLSRAASPEEVQAVFVARSRRLTAADFVEPFLAQVGEGVLKEGSALVRLAENVVGPANKRAVGDWLRALVGSHRFERELRTGAESPLQRLAHLAELHQGMVRVGLEREQADAIAHRLGEIADYVEADHRLLHAIVRAPGAVVGRLSVLLRLASGEAAPPGPASRRARTEALKLARDAATRQELLAATPQDVERLRQLLGQTAVSA